MKPSHKMPENRQPGCETYYKKDTCGGRGEFLARWNSDQ